VERFVKDCALNKILEHFGIYVRVGRRQSRLRTAARLANLIAVCCILNWRIFWLTMMGRTLPDAPPTLAFTALEIRLLDHLTEGKGERVQKTSVSYYLAQLARLGGYLAHAGDSPPGNKVIWKGLSRLTDIEFGFLIGAKLVGNRKQVRTLTI
jgi:hypothetical protein